MAQLWDLGVRGTTLDVVAAWKEALLLVALLVVAWHVRHFPAVKAADVLAVELRGRDRRLLAIPQDVLGGEATTRGELLALRHHLFPVGGVRARPARCLRVGGARPGRRARRAVGGRRRRRRARRPRVHLAAGLAGLRRARLVPRAARARLRGARPACRRTGSSTRATRTTRSGGSSRRSSRRSRARTRSSSR